MTAENSNIPNWAEVQPAPGERHLPVYLLLDTSGSMAGPGIEAVKHGLEIFRRETLADPFARDVVKVGIITFSSEADYITGGLVSIDDLQPPSSLQATGTTRLDLALQVLLESLDRDIVKPVKGGQKGDWKPAVFILTDAAPTDENGDVTDDLWTPVRDAIINRPKGQPKPSTFIAIGCGEDVDDETLKKIGSTVAFRLEKTTEAFAKFFQYVTNSLVSSAQTGENIEDVMKVIPADDSLIRVP